MKINGKVAAVILAAIAVIQLAFPVYLITEKNTILEKGQTYLIPIQWVDTDGDSKLELEYSTGGIDERDTEFRYLVFVADDKGVLIPFEGRADRPTGNELYIKSASARKFVWPVSVYRINNAREIQQTLLPLINTAQAVYTEAKIYKGRAVITGIILPDGTRI